MGEVIYYFNSYDEFEAWANNPGQMVDNNIETFASDGPDIPQVCDGNTCDGSDLGTITKVELRAHTYCSSVAGESHELHVDNEWGEGLSETLTETPEWTAWSDITNNAGMPSPWTWTNIQDMIAIVTCASDDIIYYISKIEIRITYTEAPAAGGAMQTGKYWGAPI